MSEYLEHHGILGQKWGVRRFQPYPSGYSGDGKFVGKTEKGREISNKEYRRNKKELKKDIKTARDLSNFVGSTLYKNDKLLEKKYNKASNDKQLQTARNLELDINERKEVREKINEDLRNLLDIAQKDYNMKFDINKYSPKENYSDARRAYSRSNYYTGAISGLIGSSIKGQKMSNLMNQYRISVIEDKMGKLLDKERDPSYTPNPFDMMNYNELLMRRNELRKKVQ